jgi:hypothetical protein
MPTVSAADIVAMRKALFAHIPHRDHQAVKFFTFGSNQHEVMVEGKVNYKHHHGHETNSEWAARLKIKEEGGEPKFELLQIIVVSSLPFGAYRSYFSKECLPGHGGPCVVSLGRPDKACVD